MGLFSIRTYFFLCVLPASVNKGDSQHFVAVGFDRVSSCAGLRCSAAGKAKKTINASHGVVGFKIKS